MYDLIYCADFKDYGKIKEKILEHYPEAKIEDASDDVHQARFSVELSDVEETNFQMMAIKEGFALCSLSIQLMRLEKPKDLKELFGKCGY